MIIGFSGSAGTGKSTLVEELFKLPQYSHYKRYTNIQRMLHNYLGEKFPHSSKTNDISQAGIYSCFVVQLLQEQNLICDRTLLDAFMYSKAAENVLMDSEMEDIFNKAIELYDIIFYTPIEFQIEDDGFRDSTTDYVVKTDSILQEYIKKYKDKVKIVEVRGTVEERMKIIQSVLNELNV